VLPGHFLEYLSSNFIASRLCRKRFQRKITKGEDIKWEEKRPYLWKDSSVSANGSTLLAADTGTWAPWQGPSV